MMRVRIALVVLVVCLVAWFYASGTSDLIDPRQMRVWLQRSGAWGGALFIFAYACLQPLGLRSVFFLLIAPLVWEPMDAFLLSWAGTIGASLVAFGFARFVARDWVQRKLPTRMRGLDDQLATRGFRTVLLLRLVFFTTPVLQYALGVSRVAVVPFFIGTSIGVVPFTALMTTLGAEMSHWLGAHPISSWPWERYGSLIVLLAVVAAVAAFLFVRKWQDKLSVDQTQAVQLSLERES